MSTHLTRRAWGLDENLHYYLLAQPLLEAQHGGKWVLIEDARVVDTGTDEDDLLARRHDEAGLVLYLPRRGGSANAAT